MTILMIKDLSRTEQLDRKAMAAVHGGFFPDPPSNPRPRPVNPNEGEDTPWDRWWRNYPGQ
jgi:hypothetical protein